MVEFRLPKNSRVAKGKVWEKPDDAENLKEIKIYRYNPDDNENPRNNPIAIHNITISYLYVL